MPRNEIDWSRLHALMEEVSRCLNLLIVFFTLRAMTANGGRLRWLEDRDSRFKWFLYRNPTPQGTLFFGWQYKIHFSGFSDNKYLKWIHTTTFFHIDFYVYKVFQIHPPTGKLGGGSNHLSIRARGKRIQCLLSCILSPLPIFHFDDCLMYSLYTTCDKDEMKLCPRGTGYPSLFTCLINPCNMFGSWDDFTYQMAIIMPA